MSLYLHPPSINHRAASQLSPSSKLSSNIKSRRPLQDTPPGFPRNNQSPACHSANCEIPPHDVSLFKDSNDKGLRTVFTVQMPTDKLPSTGTNQTG
ncbi:hypothetical protein TNCV_317331 [Trichonephila clavipes]|nr:hypothetical protein TNCV_317331 [Trichonephila clavipes]